MNKVYRIIWSKVKERWVVVSEKVAAGTSRPATSVVAAALAGLLVAGGSAFALDPGALPTGGAITAGNGSIITNGNQMTIQQSSQQMIANWNSFNIGANAGVRFNQPNAAATALNRITDQNPSQILGSLSANGRVFLLNPAGIVFGQNARVDVGGLVASSLNMLDSDFLAGKYRFSSQGGAGDVLNRGNITALPGGVVALIAPKTANEGTITADRGSVLLAAANQVLLDFNGDGLISYTVDQGAVDALSENKGLIRADGGLVVMTATAADTLSRAVVNNSGVLEATGLVNDGGTIKLLASDRIEHTGSINVDAGKTGHGGTALLIASLDNPGSTGHFAGSISARGGSEGGNGGFIETSGSQVEFGRNLKIDAGSPQGKGGTWLIDPVDLTINATGAGNIQGALNNGTNVEVTTSACNAAHGACSGSTGNLTLATSIAKTAGGTATLSLVADGFLHVNSGVTITDAGAPGALDVNLHAAGPIRIADNATATTVIDVRGNSYFGGKSFVTNATGNTIYADGIYIGTNTTLRADTLTLRGQGRVGATGSSGDPGGVGGAGGGRRASGPGGKAR